MNNKTELELLQVKKDILVFYDFSLEEYGLTNALIEKNLMPNSYWDYLNVKYDEEMARSLLLESDASLIRLGSLIIVIGILTECLDLASVNRDELFHGVDVGHIEDCVKNFVPLDVDESRLLKNCLLGFRLLKEARVVDDQYDHHELSLFIDEGVWIKKKFIVGYFKNRSDFKN